jgi:hypothetical protein
MMLTIAAIPPLPTVLIAVGAPGARGVLRVDFQVST